LTTVVARVCLDMPRSRTARHEVPLDEPGLVADGPAPENEAVLTDSVGLALLVVLDQLTPAERLAFVLHDMFEVPFHEIAPILDRSVPATKMLASRARQRVRATEAPMQDRVRQWEVVDAFLAAARGGDFSALLDVLDPDVVVRADAAASPTGAPVSLRGAESVARQAVVFAQRSRYADTGLVDGAPSVLVAPHGRPVTVLAFTFTGGSQTVIATIEIIADPERLGGLVISSR
jgi:RNA polymerase sigma-70 factor (ECF subfamily)